MNKVLRVLVLTVVVLTMVVPMAVSDQIQDTLTIPGQIFNGTNGGPAEPVIVRLWRDTGGGDVMIQEKKFDGPQSGKTWRKWPMRFFLCRPEECHWSIHSRFGRHPLT